MHHATQFLAFLAAAFGLSAAMWLLMGRRGLMSWIRFGGCVAVLFTPLIIQPQHVLLRAWACVLAIELFFKTTDYAAQRLRSPAEDRRFPSYASFLVPFPVFFVRFGQRTRGLGVNGPGWYATAAAVIAFGSGFALVGLASHVAMIRSSFLIDHTVKFFVFTLTVESLARVLHRLEHLAGYRIKPLINNAWRSQTVGEFWCRYNTRIHAWFDQNVFRRQKGRRAPIQAVFLTFFVSAMLHEIGFAVATSRIDGYQFAFFMLQAPAVILWRLVQRATTSTFGKVVLHCSTILWMWSTSMLFFHGVDRVFPFFYVSDPWLP